MRNLPYGFDIYLVNIKTKVRSNKMPFIAWKHKERNRQRDRKKYVMISWGFVIPAVQYIAFFRAYLDTILKALG